LDVGFWRSGDTGPFRDDNVGPRIEIPPMLKVDLGLNTQVARRDVGGRAPGSARAAVPGCARLRRREALLAVIHGAQGIANACCGDDESEPARDRGMPRLSPPHHGLTGGRRGGLNV